MSDKTEIKNKVVELIVSHLVIEADRVIPEASFVDDLGADSLDTVELIMAFEEEFGIEIHDDKAEEIVTVGDAISVIEKMTT